MGILTGNKAFDDAVKTEIHELNAVAKEMHEEHNRDFPDNPISFSDFMVKILSGEVARLRVILDGVVKVGNEEALEMARRLATEEGLLCGISSGAAVTAALKYAAGEGSGSELIVVIIPSFGERYIQTKLFEPYAYEGSDDIVI